MKKMFLLFSMVLSFAFVFGQPAISTLNSFDSESEQHSAMIYLPYSPEVIIAAMENYRDENQNYKPATAYAEGYQSFWETPLVRNNPENSELTFRIGLRNMENKNVSVVYLLLNSLNDETNNNYSSRSFDIEEARSYLDNLAIAIRTYASGEQIKLQTSRLEKANRKQSTIVKSGYKLENKKAQLSLKPVNQMNTSKNELLDRQIKANKEEEIDQALEIEKQTADLKKLMAVERMYRKDV